MKQFLYLFRGGDEEWGEQSPEEIQAQMQKWGVWMEKLGKQGNLASGEPLEQEGKVVEKNGEIVTDGPYAEGKEVVGGYLIIKANDLDHAVELSKGCPIFDFGGTTEVRPIAEMEG